MMSDPFPYRIPGAALWDWRRRAIALANTHHIDPAEVDWLLRGGCQVESIALRLGTVAQIPEVPAQMPLDELEQRWNRRVHDRVPIQHVLGQTTWRQFTLQVSPAVLIPRPETELIIDYVAEAVDRQPQPQQWQGGPWADLGTGSGAIALGLATTFPEAEILAVDISPEALVVARQNAENNHLGDRIRFLQGSWFEPLQPWRGQLAGMVSNPPYIPGAIVPTLAPEVAHHEPHLALDGGSDGLDCIRHLVREAPAFLQPQGFWLVELMRGQAPTVMDLLAKTGGYQNICPLKDLAGIERFVLAQTASL